MGYRTFATIKLALIGTGDSVENYAMRYADADHEVFMAWTDGDSKKTISPALAACENVYVCSIEEAAEQADFIVIATPPKDVREVAYWLGDVRKKVIIDATSNFYLNEEEQVNTYLAIKAITGLSHIVKVFSTRGYEHLLRPLFGHEQTQLVMAGDSKKSKEVAKILGEGMGIYSFFDMGGSDIMPLFNAMTTAWHKLQLPKDKTLITTTAIRI